MEQWEREIEEYDQWRQQEELEQEYETEVMAQNIRRQCEQE